MAMKGTYSDGKGKYIDPLVILHGTIQSFHLKHESEFQKSQKIYASFENEKKLNEELKYLEEIREAKKYLAEKRIC